MLQELLRSEAEDFESLVTCYKASLDAKTLISNIPAALVAVSLLPNFEFVLFFIQVSLNFIKTFSFTDWAKHLNFTLFSLTLFCDHSLSVRIGQNFTIALFLLT